MKIYYNSSLWNKEKGSLGLPQKVNWKFENAGLERFLPFVYRFPKGIVFDIITILDEAKLHEFYKKYELIEERLTPLQRRCAKQEHPYQDIPINEIWIDGKRVERGYSSSSSVSIPWALENNKLEIVRKAYFSILKDIACFACQRFCVPYPETASKVKKLLRLLRFNRVNNIKLSTRPAQWFHPLDICFEMSVKNNQKEVGFEHPVTGIAHTLYFQNAKLVEMPLGANVDSCFYTIQSMYEIEPALPEGDTLQFNNSIQYTEPAVDKFRSKTASSIGIIGGACGPTSIFVSTKDGERNIPRGLHGLLLHNCLSVPSFKKDDASHFILEGINIKIYDSKEYDLK